MKQFYTVDRLSKLQGGQVLQLLKSKDLHPKELQTHVDALFADGVSPHGDKYFLRNSSLASVASPAIEFLFEYVRRAHSPRRPSRFQSWFATESIEDAKSFRTKFGGSGPIWQVTAAIHFRANMNLLTSNHTSLVYSWFAHTYWRGEAGPVDPFWEVLLVPPVRVLERVE